jgi:hypothetical protein
VGFDGYTKRPLLSCSVELPWGVDMGFAVRSCAIGSATGENCQVKCAACVSGTLYHKNVSTMPFPPSSAASLREDVMLHCLLLGQCDVGSDARSKVAQVMCLQRECS